MTTDYLPVCFRARYYGDVRTVVVVSGRPGRQPTSPTRPAPNALPRRPSRRCENYFNPNEIERECEHRLHVHRLSTPNIILTIV